MSIANSERVIDELFDDEIERARMWGDALLHINEIYSYNSQ